MDIIGKDGIRGHFLKLLWIKISILVFIFVVLPILDIIYFFHLLNDNRGGLLFHEERYSTFETFFLLIHFFLIFLCLLPFFLLLSKDEKKSEPAIVIKNKKDTVRDVLVVLEIVRKTFISCHNLLFSFSFYCYHCKNVIKINYHNRVDCNQCNHYGKLSTKLIRCKCHTIFRYLECPFCRKDLDLIKYPYNHKKLKYSKYQ